MSLDTAPNVPLNEVEWRVDGQPSENKARFVPYIDARIAARLLDEWVGPANWKDAYEHGTLDGKSGLWCFLSVRCDDEWVTKCDVGVPSNFEAQKGMVSDAFKRTASIKWGVARNVYDLPTVWAPCRVDGKGRAWPNKDTLPEILRQLKAAGYEADGGTVTAQHTDDESPSEAPQKAAEPDPQVARLKELNRLLTPDQKKAYREWRESEGIPEQERSPEQITACVEYVEGLTKGLLPAEDALL